MIYTICWIEFVYWQHHYIFIIQLKKNQLRVLTGVSMMTNIARHPMTIKLYDIEGLWWLVSYPHEKLKMKSLNPFYLSLS